jgi:hypothetical protein
MGNASRGQSARERIVAQQAAARQAAARQAAARQAATRQAATRQAATPQAEARRPTLIGGGSIVAVVVIVLAFILARTLAGTDSAAPSGPQQLTGAALAKVIDQVTSVPVGALAAVGQGTSTPKSVAPVTAAPLLSGGRPEVLYVGAEFCPYCATERWPIVVALSRFGTFSGLGTIKSSTESGEPYPGTATLTFYGSRYASRYLTFTAVETEKVNDAPLQSTTARQNALLQKYTGGTIPFVDFGGRYVVNGASYDPQVLQGLSWSQIAAALHDPSSAIAKGADGTANIMTAAICKVTGNQPAGVCDAAPVSALESTR